MICTDTTKSVLGMIKTAARRPLGGMQTAWMVCHPTLDALWFARLHREFELRIRRTARAKVDTALGRILQAREGSA